MSLENSHYSVKELDTIFENSKKIFFVGIGGISMSALAEYCIYRGKEVYGYDRERSDVCKKLERVAKKIKYCSTPDSASHMDMVIYTGAIDKDNFEIQCAIKENIPLVSRANFLGSVTSQYKHRIGIAGMHGKSTVTSLVSHIFEVADKNPTVFCGGIMREYLSQYKFGEGEHIIFEACEYMDSFHCLYPTDSVVLNMDFDHPDYFKSKEQILDSFRKYAKIGARVFINLDDAMSMNAFDKEFREENPQLEFVTFGIESKGEYSATVTDNGFIAYRNGKKLTECALKQRGIHMVYNGLCALAVAHKNGIAPEIISLAISSFEGVERRLELFKKGQGSGDIYIDYAHHPREIQATLNALRQMGYKNILCVFQAHTYSRTFALYSEFKGAFKDASRLIIAPIYPARERNIYGITSEGFALDMRGEYIEDFKRIKTEIDRCESDAIVIMGAGDIIKLKNLLI